MLAGGLACALRQAPRGLAVLPAISHQLSTAATCMDDSNDADGNKTPLRRPQQAHLADTRRTLRERIGERQRSDGIMTPLGLRAIRNQNRADISRESYQKATRALAQAHLKKLPWMAQFLKHPIADDPEGYTVLGTVGRVVKDETRSPARGATTNRVDLHQTMIADFNRVRGESVMQLNANRRYRVKDTYKPEDLNPYKREKAKATHRAAKISKLMHKGTLFDKNDRLAYTPEQVRRDINFKNVSMLMHFTGRQGNILGRRQEVPAVIQRKVSRAVKNARQMALMPHVGLHPAFPGAMAEALQDVFDHLEARSIAGQ